MLFLIWLFILLLLVSSVFVLIILFKNKALAKKVKDFNFLLLNSHQNEKNNQKRISELLHEKLQGDLIATKNFIFIYTHLKDENDKREMFSNVQLTLDASILNARNLSHKLMPPFLDKGDFVKAVEYYFDTITKSTGKQFLITTNITSLILSNERVYELFKIVEIFCDYVIESETATQFSLILNQNEIVLIDNGLPYTLNLEDLSLAKNVFLSLPSRLLILYGELEQQITEKGNRFVLKINNN